VLPRAHRNPQIRGFRAPEGREPRAARPSPLPTACRRLRHRHDLSCSLGSRALLHMTMNRRAFLRSSALAAGAAATMRVPGFRRLANAQPLPPPFSHGVASGDPLPDGMIIWTRVTPTAEALPGSGAGPAVDVGWVVATDPGLRTVVQRGTARTDASRDHTVKVDVRGLAPATRYYYGFALGEQRSVTGAAKTAPAVGASVANLRFGLASCSNFEGGHFAGYRGMADRADLDFVLHVGDYIYEYEVGYYGAGPDIGREHKPRARHRHPRRLPAALRVLPGGPRPPRRARGTSVRAHVGRPRGRQRQLGGGGGEPRPGDPGLLLRAVRQREPGVPRVAAGPRAPRGPPAAVPAAGVRRPRHAAHDRQPHLPQRADLAADLPGDDPAVDDPERTMLGREQKEWFKAGWPARPRPGSSSGTRR
jgi:hypothetical protein